MKRGGAKRAGLSAVTAVVGWYVLALAVLLPLTDAPVVDSWLYGAAVRRFLRTGEIRFAGFTQAMAVAQVVYGAAWGRIFGANAVALEDMDLIQVIDEPGEVVNAIFRYYETSGFEPSAAEREVQLNL